MYRALCAAMIIVAGTFAASAQTAVAPEVVKDLAPTGKLRAAINLGNSVLAQKDAASGEPKGITVDLARELGKRLGVPVELVTFDAAGKVFEALKAGAWDIALLAIEPVRAAEIDFTAPYVLIEGTYMVPKDSPLKVIADVDRAGRAHRGRPRLGLRPLPDPHHQERHHRARRGRRRARDDRAVRRRQARGRGRREAAAGRLRQDQSERAGDGRPLHGDPAGHGHAQGPRRRRARYLRGFVEEMKASGFVADALKRSNQDAAVAPPATN